MIGLLVSLFKRFKLFYLVLQLKEPVWAMTSSERLSIINNQKSYKNINAFLLKTKQLEKDIFFNSTFCLKIVIQCIRGAPKNQHVMLPQTQTNFIQMCSKFFQFQIQAAILTCQIFGALEKSRTNQLGLKTPGN